MVEVTYTRQKEYLVLSCKQSVDFVHELWYKFIVLMIIGLTLQPCIGKVVFVPSEALGKIDSIDIQYK